MILFDQAKGVSIVQGPKYLLAMTNEQKIEAAYKRILELELLIRHWKASQASSEHVALELIEGVVNEDYELEAA